MYTLYYILRFYVYIHCTSNIIQPKINQVNMCVTVSSLIKLFFFALYFRRFLKKKNSLKKMFNKICT